MKSVKRTAEKSRNLAVIMQPSASRTTNPSALYPSSKLLDYYHSSACGLINLLFCAKPRPTISKTLVAPARIALLCALFERLQPTPRPTALPRAYLARRNI